MGFTPDGTRQRRRASERREAAGRVGWPGSRTLEAIDDDASMPARSMKTLGRIEGESIMDGHDRDVFGGEFVDLRDRWRVLNRTITGI